MKNGAHNLLYSLSVIKDMTTASKAVHSRLSVLLTKIAGNWVFFQLSNFIKYN